MAALSSGCKPKISSLVYRPYYSFEYSPKRELIKGGTVVDFPAILKSKLS